MLPAPHAQPPPLINMPLLQEFPSPPLIPQNLTFLLPQFLYHKLDLPNHRLFSPWEKFCAREKEMIFIFSQNTSLQKCYLAALVYPSRKEENMSVVSATWPSWSWRRFFWLSSRAPSPGSLLVFLVWHGFQSSSAGSGFSLPRMHLASSALLKM